MKIYEKVYEKGEKYISFIKNLQNIKNIKSNSFKNNF